MSAVHVLRTLRGGAWPLALSAALVAAPAAALLDRTVPDRPGIPHLEPAQAGGAAVSPYQEPAPNLFEATGTALWDGKRTLQGVWVAHPLATSARRVRIYNSATGAAVDGALFKRDPALSGPAVLVSSEAAQFLGMSPNEEVGLRIVALTPLQRPQAAVPSGTAPAPASPAEPARAPAPPAAVVNAPAAATAPVLPGRPSLSGARVSDTAPDMASASALADLQTNPGTGAIRLAAPATADPPSAAAPADGQHGAVRIPAPRPDSEPGAAPAVLAPRGTGMPATSAPILPQLPAITSLVEPAAEAPAPSPVRPVFQAAPESPGDVARTAPALGAPSATAGAPGAGQAVSISRTPPAAQPAMRRGGAPASPEVAPPPAPMVIASAPVPDAPTAPAAGANLSKPFVQAGIFGNAKNAQRLIGRLEAANLPAQGRPITLNGRAATRVLAGPFAGAAERDQALRAIRGMGLKDAAPVAR